MPSATAIKYLQQASSGPAPLASFVSDGPLVYDGSVGDHTTGYAMLSAPTVSKVLYDLGASPQVISKFEIAFVSGSVNMSLYYSNDGSTWTSGAGGLAVDGSIVSITPTPSVRYVQIIAGVIAGSPGNLSDVRIYDGTGTIISGPSSAPLPPTGVSSVASCNGNVLVSWTASSGATSYDVYRGTVNGGPYGTHVGSGVAGVSFTDTTGIQGSTYYYVITASNTGGTSANSSQATASLSGIAGSATVALITKQKPATIALSSASSSPGVLYRWYRGSSPTGPWTQLSDTIVPSYTDTTIPCNGVFYYQQTIVNGGLECAAGSNSSPITMLNGWAYVSSSPFKPNDNLVPQGSFSSTPPDGNDRPSTYQKGKATWDILYKGSVIATNLSHNGWNVGFDGDKLTIYSPSNSAIDHCYEARYDDGLS